jgi:hypothetical protein
MGWRGWTARLLALVVLLASLLVPPPPAEAATLGAAPALAGTPAAADGLGNAGEPSRPDGFFHAGAHCACQAAHRPELVGQTAPRDFGVVIQPIPASRALASREAEPPARPPRA